jgi:rubrerythrin
MQTFASVNDALDFAIGKEQEAHDFYVSLSAKAGNPSMSQAFLEFAQEELGHKAKLQAVRQGQQLISAQGKVMDLKIGDYLVEVNADDVHTYQQALIVAMKQEKAAYKLYMDISASLEDAAMQQLFLALANEEAKHKLRFELEYDEHVLREN